MSVLHESQHLLFDDDVIESCELRSHLLELADGVIYQALNRRVLYQIINSIQMGQSRVVNLLWSRALEHLIFQAHDHQVKELPHRGGIQLHYRRMSQLFKNLPR